MQKTKIPLRKTTPDQTVPSEKPIHFMDLMNACKEVPDTAKGRKLRQ